MTSVPVPVSPVTSTVDSVGATLARRSSTARNAGDLPTISSSLPWLRRSSPGERCDAAVSEGDSIPASLPVETNGSIASRSVVSIIASLARRNFEHRIEHPHQRGFVHRLPEERDRPCFEAPALLLVTRLSGDEDDRYRAPRHATSQL